MIRFPKALVWDHLGVSLTCWTLNVMKMSVLLLKDADTRQAGSQRGNISISYDGFGRPKTNHSLVAVTLWSSSICPLKIPLTIANILIASTTWPQLENGSQSLIHKSSTSSSSFKKYEVPRQSLQSAQASAKRGKIKMWPGSGMVSVIRQFLGFLSVIWIHCCHTRCHCAVCMCQAQLSFQGCPQWNAAIHL